MNIQFENVDYIYPSLTNRHTPAIQNITLQIESGELIGIAGCSGSGKTTFIQQLNGLLKPTSGRMVYHQKKQIPLFHQVGLVFQFPEKQLFEETVYKDVAFGPKNMGLSTEEVEYRVQTALMQVGLDFSEYQSRSPFQLSGGEQRRVAIAGILSIHPDVLVLDEPTSGLDQSGIECVEKIIQSYHSTGKTVLFISHDLDWVLNMANRILILNQGQCIYDGQRETLVQSPEIFDEARLGRPQLIKIRQDLIQSGIDIPSDIGSIKMLLDFLEKT